MDAGLVVISALLLVTFPAATTTPGSNSTATAGPSTTLSTTARTTKLTKRPPTPTIFPPLLGLFIVIWTKQCEGNVHIVMNFPYNYTPPLAVCYSREIKARQKNFEKYFYQKKKGCNDPLEFGKGEEMEGYDIDMGQRSYRCNVLTVKSTVEKPPDLKGQLHTYKVVTALLACVLILLLLIRFTRPTVQALQRKLSDKRQNRWIGPTQSHSVSYQRGKTAVVNNDGENRLSYPALERLVVSNSREPSSNRNSGFSF
ncbi:uncharacterized protein LOC125000972 isoform X2 [Mugil cephalus]|uniref:uncharacterized protein LOC125000972 isoform X2 n=1 Tax=Mugil cephalus TaxID=48193 RepID=UPI001FB7CC81|nr:uncharacterized protein LOC125000972 isoform X2 [Mugil cephalus]